MTDAELLDDDLSLGRVVFRLFHEEGVRFESPTLVRDECTCSRERLEATMLNLPDDELIELAREAGSDHLKADCQFCNRNYEIPLKNVISSTQH